MDKTGVYVSNSNYAKIIYNIYTKQYGDITRPFQATVLLIGANSNIFHAEHYAWEHLIMH